MTIRLIYRPPKLNPSFIPEMSSLLSTFCTTPSNIIVLGDENIHVSYPSCRVSAGFLQLLYCLNLTQLADVPTQSRGHTLDLVITGFAPLLVYDLGVAEHKAVSMELPRLFPHIKPKSQICFRNLTNINPETMLLDLQHLLSTNLTLWIFTIKP